MKCETLTDDMTEYARNWASNMLYDEFAAQCVGGAPASGELMLARRILEHCYLRGDGNTAAVPDFLREVTAQDLFDMVKTMRKDMRNASVLRALLMACRALSI